MKLRVILPGLLALVLLFTACAPPPELRDPNLLADTGIVSGEPCDAPCWRGITPGETSWSDALTIIEDDTTLENLQTQEDENSNAARADWNQQGGAACCEMYTFEGELVDVLFLRLAPTQTLGDVIERHGEPAYVKGSPYSDTQAVMNIVYPDKNFVVYVFVAGPEASVSASSEIVGVLYMKPDDMRVLVETTEMHAWEGYAAYAEYSEDNPSFEVTPVYTLTPAADGG
ncbi:MAG: hypothetical protein IAE80_01650 [Anaerolinea sp.]|nr:hypothetical protein [Anaerolinea sp.]